MTEWVQVMVVGKKLTIKETRGAVTQTREFTQGETFRVTRLLLAQIQEQSPGIVMAERPIVTALREAFE